jgi:hypothetical protein
MAEGTTSEAAPTLWQKLWYTRLSDALRFRFDASLDWRRVLAAADLPAELKQVVYDTVRATRLWNREKVDVTRELVDHFLDGLDRGRPAPILVATFGDVKPTAALIRRAKKRGRPLVWHAWRCGSWTIGATAAVYAILVMYFLFSDISPTINYLAAIDQSATNVPVSQQAWPMYRRALTSLGYRVSYERPFGLSHRVTPSDAEWPKLRKYLNQHAASLAELRTAAAQPHFGSMLEFETQPEEYELLGEFHVGQEHPGESHPSLMNAMIPRVEAVRSAAELLVADTSRALRADETGAAYENVIALLSMSQQLNEGPVFVTGMHSIAVQELAIDRIEHVLTTRPSAWSDQQLVELAHRLGAFKFNCDRWLDSERVQMLDMVQRIYSDDGRGDGQITYEGLRWLNSRGNLWGDAGRQGDAGVRLVLCAGMPIAVGAMASRAEIEQKLDQLILMAATDFQRPLWDERKRSASSELRRWARSPWLRIKYAPILVMSPAFQAVDMARSRGDGRGEGALIGIALELYHREHGKWPKSLAELSPRWLPKLPADRMTGQPLHYQIINNRPVVYSVGADRDDDEGRAPTDDDGRPSAYLASPATMFGSPFDGDWVIWSTVPAQAMPKWEPVEMGSEDIGVGDDPAR